MGRISRLFFTRAASIGVALLATARLGVAGPDPDVQRVSDFGKNPGNLSMYRYVPSHMPDVPRPLVVALHGCAQMAWEYAKTSGWNALAEEHKFYALYPEQSFMNNPLLCFNWAGEFGDPTNLKRGEGENLSIIEMIRRMERDFPIDRSKVFVTGFSAGGSQTALMMATWPDVFSAGAILAGVPFHCTTDFFEVSSCVSQGKDFSAQTWAAFVREAYPEYSGPYPRLSIWRGSDDHAVGEMNSTGLVRQWTEIHRVSQKPSSVGELKNHVLEKYTNEKGETVVENCKIQGLRHAVPVDPGPAKDQGGSPGQWAQPAGIFSSYYIARFWKLLD